MADETIELWDVISISAGVRVCKSYRSRDYLRVTHATVGAIARARTRFGVVATRSC